MGYIDADVHVVECTHTWEFFDPGEEAFSPVVADGRWRIQDLLVDWPSPMISHWMREFFPAGAIDLSDPVARLEAMDELGVDVHILFSTFWIAYEVPNPVREAAMARSYHRWLAEATADSGGRLGWTLHPPVRIMDRCIEELEFGKENGAVAICLMGQPHGMSFDDPLLLPLFEKAQDLDLPISIHAGSDMRSYMRNPGSFLHSAIMPVPGALWAVLHAGLSARFPRLRWSFMEAGASWLPFVLQEAFRADPGALVRSFKDWRAAGAEAIQSQELYVSVQMDDDLPYLLGLAGEDRLVHGTDYGHLDIGSDPNGLHVVASRSDIDPVAARKIVDDNSRRLYGIDPAFQPAPSPTTEGLILAPGSIHL